MTEQLFDAGSDGAAGAPDWLKARATAEGKQILKIVWDRAGGYSQHAWGYMQWSLRPFGGRYGCDGMTDANIHLIAIRLCGELGLDYFSLYEMAYPDRQGDCWLRRYDFSREEGETVFPELLQQSLRNLLYNLGEINARSILAVLEDDLNDSGTMLQTGGRIR